MPSAPVFSVNESGMESRRVKQLISINRIPLSSAWLIVLSALFIVFFSNLAFFRDFVEVYGLGRFGLVHLASIALLLFAVLILVLALLCWPPIQKLVLTVLFLVSAIAAYFMDSYNVVFDPETLSKIMAGDLAVMHELITLPLLAYVVYLGVLPAAMVWLLRIRRETAGRAVLTRLSLAGGAGVVAMVLLTSSSAFYSSYLGENRTLRYYANPLMPLYAAYESRRSQQDFSNGVMERIGLDAHVSNPEDSHELVVMVVGETARADRFSLNGYGRDTNPQLARLGVISFSNVSSCGTTTLVSLPCMFSVQNRAEFDRGEFDRSENALDVLRRAGVTVLWRDNNSSPAEVAGRVQEQDFRSAELNPDCDVECRDEGMLSGLQAFIDGHPDSDILVVLRQMGSQGPAYFRRYPESFGRFQPSCDSPMLEACARSEIENSYDNSILYTDHFLARVIDVLKANDDQFETAMFYVSDHGESLGESGIYLHGYPYDLAPEEQTRVPVIMWFGRNYDDVDSDAMRAIRSSRLSHDYVYHTLLGLFEVASETYDPGKDILQMSRGPATGRVLSSTGTSVAGSISGASPVATVIPPP